MPDGPTRLNVDLLDENASSDTGGLPAETFLDVGNRGAFREPGGAITLHPEFAITDAAQRVWEEKACAPSLTIPPPAPPSVRHGKQAGSEANRRS